MLNSRAWLSRYLPILSRMSSQEDLEVAREQVAEQVDADPERELGIIGASSSPSLPKAPSESSINNEGDLDIEIAPESPAPSSSSSSTSPAFIPPRISRRHSEASLLIGTTSKRQLNVPQDTHVGSVSDHLSLIDEWDEVHGSTWNWKNHSDSSDDGDISEEHKKWELDSKEEEAHPFARYDDLSNMSYGGVDSILDSPQKQAPPPVHHSKFETFRNWSSEKYRSCLQKTPYYIPVVQWLPRYDVKANLLNDLIAGFTVAAVLIPQSIAYAGLAQVQPNIALYTAWMPLICYSLLGTSKQLAIGPEGVISLLTGSAISITVDGSDLTNDQRAAILALLVGLFTLLLGIFRLGFLDNLISRPILHGFVSASASIIVVEQLDSFLGFSVPQHEWEKIVGVLENLDLINWYAVAISVSSFIFIVCVDITKAIVSKKYPVIKLFPTALVVVIVTTLSCWFWKLNDKGVIILNSIPSGFAPPAVPALLDFTTVKALLVPAVLISVVGFVESNAIAKTYGNKYGYAVSANRELVALGTANTVSSFFGAYPAFGSFSRSSVADTAGTKTQLVGFVAAMVVTVFILFLMPLLTYLPKSAIAAIVMVAAGKLVEFHFAYLRKIQAYKEMVLTIVTFLATFFLGAELGIICALLISIFLVVKHTTMPSVFILGRTMDGGWRDIGVSKKGIVVFPGILVIRIDDSLYFGNVEQLVKMIYRIVTLGELSLHPTAKPVHQEPISGLIIDARNIHSIDANSIIVLNEMIIDYKRRNIEVCFSHLRESSKQKLLTICPDIDEHCFFKHIDDALRYLQHRDSANEGDLVDPERKAAGDYSRFLSPVHYVATS